MLCTIASTGRLLREYEERHGEPVRVHTIIVDECGCTPKRGRRGRVGTRSPKYDTHLFCNSEFFVHVLALLTKFVIAVVLRFPLTCIPP